MLYLLTITFEPLSKLKKQDAYYAILGAILQLFHNDESVYSAIEKLSFSVTESEFSVFMTINGEEKYNQIVHFLLSDNTRSISVNGMILKLQDLRLDFKIFDPNSIEYHPFSKFQLRFYSPTFVRQENILYSLPQADQFLASVLEKLLIYYPFDIDKKSFKKWLKSVIYVGEFKIKSELFAIKKNKKSGVVGYCRYYLDKKKIGDDDQEYVNILYLLLQAIKFTGIGSGVKLGCGNVGCFIS